MRVQTWWNQGHGHQAITVGPRSADRSQGGDKARGHFRKTREAGVIWLTGDVVLESQGWLLGVSRPA